MFPKIKGIINKQFCFGTALSVPDVKLDNCHVRLWEDFDNSGFSGQEDILMWLMKLVTFLLEILFLSDYKYRIPVILR